MKLSQRVTALQSSQTLEISSIASRMKAQGKRVINFAAGEPDFDTPEYIKKAAVEAIKTGFTKYTPATGIPELKEAISRKLKEENCLRYSPSQIIVSCGAKHALYNILQVLCEEQDEVLIPCPYWLSYPQMVAVAQASARIVKTQPNNNFKLDKESLKRSITKKAKVLILNTPTNPTGVVYSRRELEEIAKVVIERNLYVVSDEIYEKLIFDGKKHISFASLNERVFKQTIVVNGVSKSYAMTGWRIGYLAAADEEIVKAAGNLQSHSTSNPCSISQKAACAALTNCRKRQMDRMLKEFQLRRDSMLTGLDKIGALSYLKPEGAFYVFCNISKLGVDSATFAHRLLTEAEVAVIAGAPFGMDNYVRLSFAVSRAEIKEGMSRLKDWVEKQ